VNKDCRDCLRLAAGSAEEEILDATQEFQPKEMPALAFGDDPAADRMAMLVVGG